MFPKEIILSSSEEVVVFKIRQLIGDEKRTVVDDIYNVSQCANVKANGSMYGLEEPKGWPTDIFVGGSPVISGVEVLNYEYLRWDTMPGPLVSGIGLTVVYDLFKHSDLEIINTYDTSAHVFLTAQCGFSDVELGDDLLALSTAYVLLSKDMSKYIAEAVNLEDSDSKLDASRRPQVLARYLELVAKELKSALEQKSGCKMMSLPVYKVE